LLEKAYTEFVEGDYISINKQTKVVFKAVYEGNWFKISDVSHSANFVQNFCRLPLGQAAT